ncbi:hypothetical protein VE03_04253 [Pseudogymnoascus sp. 23342-1-I1]|nr:hypothetical protein VE03_04253 [Pseudogymnoascus sp. 23342-1-I1]
MSGMSTRRVPLSSNPNAANSPYRGMTAGASKSKRSHATVQREEAYGQPPPAKKHIVEVTHRGLKTPPRQSLNDSAEGQVFSRRAHAQPTAFDRKLEAVRRRPVQQAVAKADKASEENLETIRQWQRHYRKVFPKFVFYFESISEDVRVRYAKQVTALGAREEKFFSNAVTHVVTTRTIPPELAVSPTDAAVDSSAADANSQSNHPKTINPSLLDRSSEPAANHMESQPLKSRFTFEVNARKSSAIHNDTDIRRQQARNADVLHRARELGMKIWALEKLQRMMTTMFDTDTGSQAAHGHNTRSNTTQGAISGVSRSTREADLSALLRNERIHGPSDRDPTVATKEMIMFKGLYIYVHDVDEKQKPIMVREYAKVSNKEQGDWPQFRSVANGKCPFVPEVDGSRRDAERDAARQQRQQEKEKSAVPRTRAAAAVQARMQPPTASSKRALMDGENAANRNTIPAPLKQRSTFSRATDPSQSLDAEPSSKGPQNAFVSRAGVGRLFGGEPVASGLQQSNITSAIRSQMISSTAAGPGAKAGTSKEVYGLQRKVLERTSGPTSLGLASSHRMTDLNIVSKDEAGARIRKRKNQESLGGIEEDGWNNEQENTARRTDESRTVKALPKRKVVKRDPKPGYCENCMDKFDDFEEHCVTRKHRRFAEKSENWTELDALLSQLGRPLKEDPYYA